MAVKTADNKDLVLLSVRLNWKGQTGLSLTLDPQIGGVVMSVAHVDELIGELIKYRDVMAQENGKLRQ